MSAYSQNAKSDWESWNSFITLINKKDKFI